MTAERFNDMLVAGFARRPRPGGRGSFQDRARLKKAQGNGQGNGCRAEGPACRRLHAGQFPIFIFIYRAQPRRTLIQMIEIWAGQFGPYMRVDYGRFGTAKPGRAESRRRLPARSEMCDGFGRGISTDISAGMGLIGHDSVETP